MCSSFVYIVATGKNGQIHTGLTSNLVQRVWQHRSGQMADIGLPAACGQLVWYETYETLAEATAQLEKLDRWPDAWLTRLIENANPDWSDQWAELDAQPKIEIGPGFTSIKPPTPAPSYPVIRPMQQVA